LLGQKLPRERPQPRPIAARQYYRQDRRGCGHKWEGSLWMGRDYSGGCRWP
jgi:hypothetical protein